MSDAKDVGLAVVTGGLALPVQAREERKAAERDQNRARQAERRIQNVRAARERRQAARSARVALARQQQASVQSGAAGSSSAVTGAGSIQSQLASNVSFLDQVGQLTNQQSIFLQKAADHQGQAQDFQSVFDLGMKGVSAMSGGA